MINRRRWLVAGGTLAAGAVLMPRALWAEAAEMNTSPLIYVTPIRSNGSESRCQAEVWFAAVGGSMYVVTAADAWRSQAVRRGLTSARVWIGDVGEWHDSDGKYRELPSVEARASVEADATVQARVLAAMGEKYTREWGSWGPRFRNGLSDGSRVMLKYQPA
jgi:hypothetical protein